MKAAVRITGNGKRMPIRCDQCMMTLKMAQSEKGFSFSEIVKKVWHVMLRGSLIHIHELIFVLREKQSQLNQ